MKAWYDILDAATVQRIRTYSAFNDPQSKHLMIQTALEAGAEIGYQKAKEDVKHDLMMKLKDEGIVKLLKVSILRNDKFEVGK